jgi:hypothetical protein
VFSLLFLYFRLLPPQLLYNSIHPIFGYRSRGPGFDSRRYQIFWGVVGLERDPLSLVSITEELLGRNSSGSGLGNRDCGCGDPLPWPCDTLYPQMLALTSPTSGGCSVAIVRSRTKVMEFFLVYMRKVQSRRQITGRRAPQQISNVTQKLAHLITPTVLLITSRRGPRSQHISAVAFASFGMPRW